MEYGQRKKDTITDYFGISLDGGLNRYQNSPQPGHYGSRDLAETVLGMLQSRDREQQIKALEAIFYAAQLRDELMAQIQTSSIGGEVTLRPEAVFEEAETCPECQRHPLVHTVTITTLKKCLHCGFAEV